MKPSTWLTSILTDDGFLQHTCIAWLRTCLWVAIRKFLGLIFVELEGGFWIFWASLDQLGPSACSCPLASLDLRADVQLFEPTAMGLLSIFCQSHFSFSIGAPQSQRSLVGSLFSVLSSTSYSIAKHIQAYEGKLAETVSKTKLGRPNPGSAGGWTSGWDSWKCPECIFIRHSEWHIYWCSFGLFARSEISMKWTALWHSTIWYYARFVTGIVTTTSFVDGIWCPVELLMVGEAMKKFDDLKKETGFWMSLSYMLMSDNTCIYMFKMLHNIKAATLVPADTNFVLRGRLS